MEICIHIRGWVGGVGASYTGTKFCIQSSTKYLSVPGWHFVNSRACLLCAMLQLVNLYEDPSCTLNALYAI